MRFTVECDTGRAVEFECADTMISRWVCADILEGKTYPWLPFVGDVRLILDIGANCGAASAYFAMHAPNARIHAFEPGSVQRAILDRNAAGYPNVSVHPFGLFSSDERAVLYPGASDTGMSSVFPAEHRLDAGEAIALRAAGGWVAEEGIDAVDIVKLDVEGCEVDVLRSLVPVLPTVKVLYVEYDSRAARREIEDILRPTHELYTGKLLLDQGEITYLRRDLAELPEAGLHLARAFSAAAASGGA